MCAAARSAIAVARTLIFTIHFYENVPMTQAPKGPQPKPGPTHPSPKVDAEQKQEKAEPTEVLGRHKNTGQKDHKGAR